MPNKMDIGLAQASKDAPAWAMNMTAIIASFALFAPDLIDSLPGSVTPMVKEWIEFVLKLLTVVAAVIGVVTGKRDQGAFEYLKKK